MKTLLALVFAAWTSFALAQAPAAELPKPGAKDLCPVCGMLTAKYPNWVATIVYKDGHAHHFDGAIFSPRFFHSATGAGIFFGDFGIGSPGEI